MESPTRFLSTILHDPVLEGQFMLKPIIRMESLWTIAFSTTTPPSILTENREAEEQSNMMEVAWSDSQTVTLPETRY